MTCIVGMVSGGRVYMGCDSASGGDWTLRSTLLQKVFIRSNFIIGYTTSFRMGQLLQYNLELPKYSVSDPLEFMVTQFVPAVRKTLKDGGYTDISNNRETGGKFLVGFMGQLFMVDNDFHVNQMADNFDAVGIGFPFALGAIGALLPIVKEPHEVLMRALELAGHFADGVRGPYHVKWIEAQHED